MPPLKLEEFRIDSGTGQADTAEAAALEELRLAAYDQGYAAGWDDSAAALADEQRKLQAELARNLQALSFTYHEARGHLIRAIAPLLEEIATKLLPRLAREAIAPMVLDTLMPLAEDLADAPVTIVINPAAREAVEQLLASATGLPVTLRDEPSLGEGQAYLLLGEIEARVDLDRAITLITAAVRGFFDLSEKDRKHG
jgi:flagellar biosynthesis/type III secretory pathway protein FliH